MEESNTVFTRKRISKQNIRKRVCKDSSSEDETVVTTGKALKMNLVVDKINDQCRESLGVVYKSTRNCLSVGLFDQGASSCVQTETEHHKDSRAIFERSQKIKKELQGKCDDKVYRGLTGYVNLYENNVTALRPFYKGPTRAPTNIRTTCQWDYHPDICKDFRETGFCGFGESCKFLHDRTDYKYSWEIEQLEQNKTIKDGDVKAYEVDSSDDEKSDLPFKCYICRNSFVNPIVTKCFHYFCEKFALEHFKKSMKCFICSKVTNGIFSPAHQLIVKLKQDQKL